jgi:nickel/cobalt transporter (NicO) family protein
MDAVILGIFVTLSHTSGIVLVGVLASMGSSHFVPQRIEAWLALFTGVLVIVLGLWTLWTQKELWRPALMGEGVGTVMPALPAHSHAHPHEHSREHAQPHSHGEGEAGWHSHGWGIKHSHALPSVDGKKMSLWVLIGLGIAGGLLPDPAALAILLSALAQGKVMLGLLTVVVFSVGFAATLVIVGIIAAKVGQKVLDWLSGAWAVRIQVGTSLIIVVVGVVLALNAMRMLSSLRI